jgi:hypothetical protein
MPASTSANPINDLNITLDDDTRRLLLGKQLQLLEDPTGSLSFDDASSPATAFRYRRSEAEVPNLGFTRSVYWARFTLHNTSAANTRWYIEFADSMFQHIDMFIHDANGNVTRHQAGSMQANPVGVLNTYTHVFPVALGENDRADIYLRLKTDYAFVVPLNLWHPDTYADHKATLSTLHGAYLGIALAMLAYNLALLAAFREIAHRWYALFVATVYLNSSCLNGTLYMHGLLSPEVLNVLQLHITFLLRGVGCWPWLS